MSVAPIQTSYFSMSISMDNIPSEIILNIFSWVIQSKDIHSGLLTNNRFWKLISNSAPLWQKLAASHFPYSFRNIIMPNHQEVPNHLYKHLKIINDNAKLGNYDLSSLKTHKERISCLTFQKNEFFWSSEDKTISVLDFSSRSTPEKIAIDPQNMVGLQNLVVQGKKLIYSQSGGLIRVLDLTNQPREIQIITTADQSNEIQLGVYNNVLFFNAREAGKGEVKAFDLESCKELKISFKGPEGYVSNLVVEENKLIVGFSCGTIKVWDIESNLELKTFEGPGNIVRIHFESNKLIAGYIDGMVKVWDADNGTELQSFSIATTIVDFVVFDKVFFFCCADGSIQAWNIESQGEPYTFFYAPGNPSTCLKIKEDMLIAGFFYGEIKIFNLNMPQSVSLRHLGIRSRKDYRVSLQCSPNYLARLGIFSRAELSLICDNFGPNIELLQWEIDAKEDQGFEQRQKIASGRKEKLFKSAKIMSDILKKMTIEANTPGSMALHYIFGCPWASFEQKLNAFQRRLQKTVNDCDESPEQIVRAFETEKYKILVAEMNGLIMKFNADILCLHTKHQVNRLYAYIHKLNTIAGFEKDIAEKSFRA